MRRFVKVGALAFLAAMITLGPAGCGGRPASDVAALVNGEKITKQDLNREVKMVPLSMPLLRQAGFAASEQRKLVLLSLIETTLVRQEAEKLGIKVSEKQIQDRYKMFRAGKSREAFVEEITRLGMNEAIVLKQVEAKVLEEKLLDKVLKPRKVTEQEAKDYYDDHKSRYKDLTYDEAKSLIVPALSVGKTNQARQAWLDQVKRESDIRLYSW